MNYVWSVLLVMLFPLGGIVLCVLFGVLCMGAGRLAEWGVAFWFWVKRRGSA